jgi:hypothetical protein
MNDRFVGRLGVVRCIALLLLLVAVLTIPGRAAQSCNVCQCIGGTDVCSCRGALLGEEGWSGACSATESGCLQGPGESCQIEN